MFGKKKPAPPPPPPFTMQVLTTEYLIEGQADGDSQLYFPKSEKHWSPISLSNATLRAVGMPETPVRTAARLELLGHAILAFIPRQEPAKFPQYLLWQQYEFGRQGVFYVGPYAILGTMKFQGKELFDDACPMEDVVISHRSPGAGLGEIRAPFILVNTFWLIGYEPV